MSRDFETFAVGFDQVDDFVNAFYTDSEQEYLDAE